MNIRSLPYRPSVILLALALGLLSFAALTLSASAQDTAFGTQKDQQFGNALMEVLIEENFMGEDPIMSRPYEGSNPHGTVLVTLEGEVSVDGERGEVIVKRNYGGAPATIETVSDNPTEYLMATTVMFRLSGEWFWAKYMPDGSYDTAPNGTPLVGQPTGCVSCHNNAAGNDMVFLNNRY